MPQLFVMSEEVELQRGSVLIFGKMMAEKMTRTSTVGVNLNMNVFIYSLV